MMDGDIVQWLEMFNRELSLSFSFQKDIVHIELGS
jgi:hypothetical protein